MAIRLKSGVRPDNLALLAAAVNVFAAWHDADSPHKQGVPEDLVVTSGTDGTHKVGSKHYTGQAIDVRSHTFRGEDKLQFVGAVIGRFGDPLALATSTGPGFQTADRKWLGILEGQGTPNEHFHFQRNTDPPKADVPS